MYATTGLKAALRALASVEAKEDLKIHRMDAVAAFLNRVPEEVGSYKYLTGLTSKTAQRARY